MTNQLSHVEMKQNTPNLFFDKNIFVLFIKFINFFIYISVTVWKHRARFTKTVVKHIYFLSLLVK